MAHNSPTVLNAAQSREDRFKWTNRRNHKQSRAVYIRFEIYCKHNPNLNNQKQIHKRIYLCNLGNSGKMKIKSPDFIFPIPNSSCRPQVHSFQKPRFPTSFFCGFALSILVKELALGTASQTFILYRRLSWFSSHVKGKLEVTQRLPIYGRRICASQLTKFPVQHKHITA